MQINASFNNFFPHRFEMHKFARDAYDLGVRYIGGCCGFQPYHIRAVAEELAEERGKLPEGSEKHIQWAGGLRKASMKDSFYSNAFNV